MKSFFLSLFNNKNVSLSEQADKEFSKQKIIKSGKISALSGDIGLIPLDDVVQLFDFCALTGELEIQAIENNGYFFFDKGALVFGMLGSNRQKIGEILLAEKQITNEQLDECLTIHRNQEKPDRLGNILMQKGYLKQGTLTSSLSQQVKWAFFEALTWKEGTFSFYVGQRPQKEEILLHERVDRLLLEGMVHIDNNSQ